MITIISLQPNSPEEELFLQKALLSFQYLLAPLNEQNWKKTSLELVQSYKHLLCSRPNWKQNGSFMPNKNFFRKTNNIAFVYSSPQIILGADLQLQESVTFGPNSTQNDPLDQNQNFPDKLTVHFYFTHCPLSLRKIWKKSQQWVSRINNL